MHRALLALAALTLASAAARAADPIPQFFVAGGAFSLDRAGAFDRKSPGAGRGPGLFVQAGVQARVLLTDADVALLAARAVDANKDGADIDFFLGELRIPLTGKGQRVSIGGGRVTGAGRKSSWVETLAYARDLGPKAFVEVRGIFDEGDGRLGALSVGWRF